MTLQSFGRRLLSCLDLAAEALPNRPATNSPEPDQTLVHYCIVRRDLPAGAQAAQLIHAAGESAGGPLPRGTYAVALTASAEELAALERRLIDNQVPHVAVRESDPPYAGELVAVGARPAPRAQIRRWFSSLPLVR